MHIYMSYMKSQALTIQQVALYAFDVFKMYVT